MNATYHSHESENRFELSFQDITYQIAEVEGLEIHAEAGPYHAQQFSGAWEAYWEKIVEPYAGQIYPCLRLKVQAVNAEWVKNKTQRKIPVMEIYVKRRDKKGHLALFFSDPVGESGWVAPVHAAGKLSKFEIPCPLDLDQAEQPLFGNPDEILIKVISFSSKALQLAGRQRSASRPGPIQLFQRHKFLLAEQTGTGHNWGFRDLKEEEWDKLRGKKPALLLIHGANGTPEIAFQDLLNSSAWKTINQTYEGRIFAFQHPTLFDGVKKNVEKLAKMTKGLQFGNLDILTRSRGSLVARWWLEQKGLPGTIQVRKLLMLAGPNQGSLSANKGNRYRTWRVSRMLKKLNKSVPPILLDLELAQMELEMESEMIGLLNETLPKEKQEDTLSQSADDQSVGGALISTLNEGSGTTIPGEPEYYSISAALDLTHKNWQGKEEKLRERLRERIVKTFGSLTNDGINPTKGASGRLISAQYRQKQDLSFFASRIKEVIEFPSADRIHHISYMKRKKVRNEIARILADPAARIRV